MSDELRPQIIEILNSFRRGSGKVADVANEIKSLFESQFQALHSSSLVLVLPEVDLEGEIESGEYWALWKRDALGTSIGPIWHTLHYLRKFDGWGEGTTVLKAFGPLPKEMEDD